MNHSFASLVRRGVLAAFLLTSLNATADYELYHALVVEDAAHGLDVMQGNTGTAIDKLKREAAGSSPTFAVYNNLCVAYIAAKDIAAAKESCEAAMQMTAPEGEGWFARFTDSHRYDRAIAHLNRGVINALTGNNSEAQADFERAKRFNWRLSEPAANLELLDERTQSVRTASTR